MLLREAWSQASSSPAAPAAPSPRSGPVPPARPSPAADGAIGPRGLPRPRPQCRVPFRGPAKGSMMSPCASAGVQSLGLVLVLCSLSVQSDVAAGPEWQTYLGLGAACVSPAGRRGEEGWQEKWDKGSCTKVGGITWNGEVAEHRGAGGTQGARPVPGPHSTASGLVWGPAPGPAPHLDTSMWTNSS